MPITLTENALREVKSLLKQQNLDAASTYLRVGVKGGGCSGFSYSLDLTDSKDDKDESWEFDGVSVVCDAKSLLYLDGTELDFRDEVMGRGFTFTNPNATNSCGCGSSFSV